jgi:endonuclease YncB( thermonuclease family)
MQCVSIKGVQVDTVAGRVVAIADGDNLTVRNSGSHQHHIRLIVIDAPERNVPRRKVVAALRK